MTFENLVTLMHSTDTTDVDRNDGGKITSVQMHHHVAERAQATLDEHIRMTALRDCTDGERRCYLALHVGIMAERIPKHPPAHWTPQWVFYPQAPLADVGGKPPPLVLPTAQQVAAWYGYTRGTVERYEQAAAKRIKDTEKVVRLTKSEKDLL